MCCSPNNYKVVHGVFSIRWSRLFLELIWVEEGQLEEAQRREVDGHLGEEERRRAQHVEAGLGGAEWKGPAWGGWGSI